MSSLASGFLSVAMVLILVLVVARVSVDVFPVEQVAIIGKLRDSQLASIRQRLGKVDLRVSATDEIRALLDSLTWVRQVNIRKNWPLGIEIQVHPETAIAYWNDDAFINEDGKVLVTEMLAGGNLPLLYGPAGKASEVMAGYQQLGGMLQAHGQRIKALKLSERGSWSMETQDGVEVLLGVDDLKARLQRFLSVLGRLGDKGDGREIERVDARYMKGVAVRFRDNEQLSFAGSGILADSNHAEEQNL